VIAFLWHLRYRKFALDDSYLDDVDAHRGRWHDTAAEAKGISTRCYWIGRGKDALLAACRTAGTKPNATTIREVWKQRYGGVATPLLVVVAYPRNSCLNRKTETLLYYSRAFCDRTNVVGVAPFALHDSNNEPNQARR
jgi:hypothetical protein